MMDLYSHVIPSMQKDVIERFEMLVEAPKQQQTAGFFAGLGHQNSLLIARRRAISYLDW